MRNARHGYRTLWLLLILVFVSVGCGRSTETANQDPPAEFVVVFTSHDRIFSEPILDAFSKSTGIEVRPVYDAEAAKTTGLINRLLARRDHPECDVLWNNEVAQTVALAQAGVLDSYDSPDAARIPIRYRDSQHRWTGFAGRVRVFIYNSAKFPGTPPPADLTIFADPAYRGQGVIALPFYGTTFTHVSVLHERWGEAKLLKWLTDLQRNETAIAPGNGAACDLVATGERSFGLTDTDDANGALLEGKPIKVLIPDAHDGAILIPNTVALINRAPHPAAAKKLIDYLLSAKVETQLSQSSSAQIPLGSEAKKVSTRWDSLLESAPPTELPIDAIAANRLATIELLRKAHLDQ